ncbi:PAS domain-containing protein [Natrinema sp. LN54]|uniref:PAS domain-containing protein n=1 Tax=Natrinema sp. LN54 TaxID=3458705 RepID=UPI004035288D
MTSASRADLDSAARASLRQQEVVADLGERALETDDLEQLLGDAASAVVETVDVEYASVLEVCPEGNGGRLRQGAGWSDECVGTHVSTAPDSQTGRALHVDGPVVVEDLHTAAVSGSELLADHGVVSGISVVIGCADDPWGVLGVHATEQRQFTDRDVTFVRSVANVLATGIEHARTERRFDAIFDDPNILVGLLEPDGTVLDINGTAMEYVDADLEDVTGDPFWETPWWIASGGDERADDLQSEAREWTERAAAGEYVEFETELTRPNGDRYTINGVFRPVTNDDGEVVSIIVSDRDVTERKRRERHLRDAKEQLEAATEAGAVGTWEWHIPENRMIVGTSFADTFGIDPDAAREGVPLEKFIDAIHEDDRDRVAAAINEAVETGDTYEEEYRVWNADDDLRWVVARGHVERDEDGNPVTFPGALTDITDRKRAELEAEKQRKEIQTLFDVLPVGVVVADEDGSLLRANNAAKEIWGGDVFDADDVTEYEKYSAVWAETGEPVDPEDWTMSQVLRGEAVSEPNVYEIEPFDGDRRIVMEHGMPVRDERGNVSRAVVTLTDITERREYERALEERERQLSALMENVPGMVYRCRNERGWPMEFVSDACREITGYEPDALERGTVDYGEDIMVDEDREAVWNAIQRTTDDREPFSVTYRIETADGEIRWVRSYGRVLAADEGERATLEGIISDISDRKRLENDLKESNERLEQFAYAASHDLQEPLRMITSYLQLLEARYDDAFDEDGEEFLAYAVDGAERMREMIDGLLAYSRVETGGDPLEPVDLDCVLADVLDDLQLHIEETDADVTVDDLPVVEGDASQLRQVLQNLLDNALTYHGDEPPRVRVDADRRGQEWAISVHDSGIGIDPADQERVFTVFDRLHTHEEYEGTGIGLALCQRIVERHGGEIWLESEPGEGTTFSFTLPAAE